MAAPGAALAASLLVALAAMTCVNAYAGQFRHTADGVPVQVLIYADGYALTKIGACGAWRSLPAPAAAAAKQQQLALPVTVTGSADLVVYKHTKCSLLLSDVAVNLTLVDAAGAPLRSDVALDGRPHTAPCASGGGAPFAYDAAGDLADAKNKGPWFRGARTDESGTGVLYGNAHSGGVVATSGAGALASYILYAAEGDVPLACCDFAFDGPADTNWTARMDGVATGWPCDEDNDRLIDAAAAADDAAAAGRNGANSSAAAVAAATLVALLLPSPALLLSRRIRRSTR